MPTSVNQYNLYGH